MEFPDSVSLAVLTAVIIREHLVIASVYNSRCQSTQTPWAATPRIRGRRRWYYSPGGRVNPAATGARYRDARAQVG